MNELIIILPPIALVDCLSLLPVAMMPMILFLGGQRPVRDCLSFMTGIFLTYFPFGAALLFGLDSLFHTLARHFTTWWHSEPQQYEIWLQICLGLLLIGYGQRLCAGQSRATPPRTAMNPQAGTGRAFALGALINLTGMWGALPYFAAIAKILQEDLSPAGSLMALLYYNLVFLLPLALFPLLHLLIGARAQSLFTAAGQRMRAWGMRLLTILLIGLGFLLVIDGIGWLRGHPLFVPGPEKKMLSLQTTSPPALSHLIRRLPQTDI